jgi:hypothetical protein
MFLLTVKEDISNRINNEILEVERNNAICLKEYKDNKCDPETRIPVLENFCNDKEKCFLRNSQLEIGKTRTTITILIEIINEIFERLSWFSFFGMTLMYFCLMATFKMIIHLGKTSK